MGSHIIFSFCIAVAIATQCHAWSLSSWSYYLDVSMMSKQLVARSRNVCFSAKRNDAADSSTGNGDDLSKAAKDVNPITKASWYGVEAFGKAFGRKNQSSSVATTNRDQPPTTRTETIERLRQDNEREYFLSGDVDELIYAADCTFADPFVSFDGRDRFVENLENLGSFITEYSARPLEFDVNGNIVTTKFMVKLRLNLPWKPILAWPWGVKCVIDSDTNLVTLHEETWDIEPMEGVKQIFFSAKTAIK